MRLKHIGIGCAGIIVIVAVLVGVIFFVVSRLTAEPERVARAFLEQAAAGNYAAAHDMFAVPLKESQPLAAFEQEARANPSLFAVQEFSFTDRSIDMAGARLAGTATLQAGTRVPIEFELVQENDQWKLISYSIGSRD